MMVELTQQRFSLLNYMVKKEQQKNMKGHFSSSGLDGVSYYKTFYKRFKMFFVFDITVDVFVSKVFLFMGSSTYKLTAEQEKKKGRKACQA